MPLSQAHLTAFAMLLFSRFRPMGKIVNTDFEEHPVLNSVWVVCGGFLIALLYLIVGFLWCASIIGIPFGLQSFKFAELACFPFGAYVY